MSVWQRGNGYLLLLYLSRIILLNSCKCFSKGTPQASNPEKCMSRGTTVTSYKTFYQLDCLCEQQMTDAYPLHDCLFLSFSVNWCPSYITNQSFVLYGASISPPPLLLPFPVSSHLPLRLYQSAQFSPQITKVRWYETIKRLGWNFKWHMNMKRFQVELNLLNVSSLYSFSWLNL